MLSGQQIGTYRFEALIGSGGMGEVYRAHDAKLGRDVAVKVLPAIVAADEDRSSRFEREARVLAALNHPAIASIYGFERDGDVTFLVMELVPGETLADVVHRGPVPITDALNIARQIADALDAAHQKGIVHRDLKPANVKITPEGRVKVLDFGLAKAVASEDEASTPSRSLAPTITTPAMTRAGVILGTAAYMAPEQARGKPVDKRADIWAFGCVLFEMLTGRRPFASDEVSDTLAFILTKDPDWSLLPAATPESVSKLLRRCLEKDRSKRIADIADVRLEIEEALSAPPGASLSRPASSSAFLRIAPWAIAVLASATALIVYVRQPAATAPAAAPLMRIATDLSPSGGFVVTTVRGTTISPDGMAIAFTARQVDVPEATPTVLFVRRLDELVARMLPGTSGATNPFFSPDSTQIAFFAAAKLKKMAAAGGPVVTLCDAPDSSRGGSWGADGVLVFQRAGNAWDRNALMRVSELGGIAEALPVSAKDDAGLAQRWPQLLPGGKAVLATKPASGGQASFNNAQIVVQPLPSGDPKVLRAGYFARYVPSGHLLFMQDGALFAAPFDLERLELSGPVAPVVDGVLGEPASGWSSFSVSANGTLAYTAGAPASAVQTPATWLHRSGKTSTLMERPLAWGFPRLSPDGGRLAFAMDTNGNSDIWIYDWQRDISTRLTTDPAADTMPVWSPDGLRILYASQRGDGRTANLYWQRADGTGDAQRLTTSTSPQLASSFHKDGKHVAFTEGNPVSGAQRLVILPLEGSEQEGWKPGTPEEFVSGPGLRALPEFSPDGKWVAFVSSQSGQFEVFVRPYPGPGGQWQISSNGGNNPKWSRAKPELVFRPLQIGSTLRVARYTIEGDTFRAEKPQVWSDTPLVDPPVGSLGRTYDLHPDGDRIVMGTPVATPTAQARDRVTLVFNFFDELRRLAPR